MTFQFFNELGLRVIVLDWSVSDEGGLGCISQSHIVLFEKLVTGVQARNHAARGVSTQTLPQQASQFAVTIGDICFFGTLLFGSALTQRGDHLAQSEQTFVDFDGLLLGDAFSFCEGLALRTGEIDDL